MMLPMTRKQERLYRWLKRRRDKAVGPSFAEMAKAIGAKSVGQVGGLLNGLKKRGRVDYQPGLARSVRLVK